MAKLNDRKIRSLGIILIMMVLVFFYQNTTLMQFIDLNISDVNEEIRKDQAQELLGTYYKASPVKKIEGKRYLSYLIFKNLEDSLGNEWSEKVPEIAQTLITEAEANELDPVFVLAVIQTESSYNPRAVGTSGERGLMQILPKTAEWISKKNGMKWKGADSLFDPATNIRIGIEYFAYLRGTFDNTSFHYVPAYNMGPTNVRRLDRSVGSVDENGRAKPREYAMRVMKNYSSLYEDFLKQHKELL